MSTIFKILPEGLSTIEFGISIDQASSGYYVPREMIRFNESDRINIIYSDTVLGGSAISEKLNLVPVQFDCYVWGDTRNQLMSRLATLNIAVMNDLGGQLEYRPDGATISTYYRYEKSKPIVVQDVKTNMYDAITETGGKFVLAVLVEVMTQPVATSGDAVSLISAETIANTTEFPGNNYFDVETIKGDLPAVLTLKVNNSQSGATNEINRLYVTAKENPYGALSQLQQYVEAEDCSRSAAWTTENDATRGNEQFLRVTNTDSTTWYQIYIDIPFEDAHRGFISVFPVVRFSQNNLFWRMRIGYGFATTKLWTNNTQYKAENFTDIWHIAYAGDIQFPPIKYEAEDGTVSARIFLEVRYDGDDIGETFDVDSIYLVWSDLTSLQINIGEEVARTDGLASNERFWLTADSKDLTRIGEIYSGASSGNYIGGPSSIYGSPSLLVKANTRVYFMFEKNNPVTELHLPHTEIVVDANIIYRTIFPFGA